MMTMAAIFWDCPMILLKPHASGHPMPEKSGLLLLETFTT